MNEVMQLDIIGMHCPDCPAKIERAILKFDGVAQVKINYQTEDGYVKFDNRFVSNIDIINRINKMGFETKNVQRSISKYHKLKN